MHIENHRLVNDDGDLIELREVQGASFATIVPEIIVVHYAVTDSLNATVRAQQARGYWAHLSIDGFKDHHRNSVMQVVQQLPFNRRGSHAGVSSYKGRPRVNEFSVGIEIANPGPLIEQTDGSLETVYGKTWPVTDAVKLPVPKGYPPKWTHWACYSDEEMGILAAVCLALKNEYPIVDIVGHSEIAPGRKFDPGEAFDLRWFKSLVFPPDTEPAPPMETT